ncbi:MAG: hypothetical protein HKN45_00095 [Flavobacteriales bacterium]|nr:hypothetical protein [Flavobacteriales bacterium]
MKSTVYILPFLCSILPAVSGFGQTGTLTRTFEASCESVCDGSAEILNFRISPDRSYYWRSVDARGYGLIQDATITDLCPGNYMLKQVDINYEEIERSSTPSISDDEFELIGLLIFPSKLKRDLTIYLDLNREANYLNYQTRAEFSVDGGETWRTSSQLNRKVVTDIRGIGTSRYLLNLPKIASYQDEVQVRIYSRKLDSERDTGKIQLSITSSHLESKVTHEEAVEIRAEEAMKIKSTVSNEMDGADGYISLDVQGGYPPYSFKWEDGNVDQTRRGLEAGTYVVEVIDKRMCQQEAKFTILPPIGKGSPQNFNLNQTLETGVFKLEIIGLYRQPMNLIITRPGDLEVKRFRINPLYDDLFMELDLSFLPKGNYNATLSTAEFSKKTNLLID